MVPAITEGGRSFKSAALYYLHDKRREGEAERLTGARVAWTHTLNLMTDDPEAAWRRMARTAMIGDDLKKAAGVKATGRKMTKPVFAYSLSWDPSEQPTREEQLAAAMETIKLLGLTEHQAVIVAHNDEPHAHVHVIVNKVHPVEGRGPDGLSNSKLKLSAWAEEYERGRGKILCQQRVENNAKRKRGEHVRDPRQSRTAMAFEAAAKSGSVRAAFVGAEQKAKDAALSQAGRDMQHRHRQDWDASKLLYREGKDRIYRRADERRQAREAEIKAEMKPQWAAFFRDQRGEQRGFEGRESSPLGKLWNMVSTAREVRREDNPGTPLGKLWTIVSGKERRNVFDRAQERERLAMARAVSARMREEAREIRRQAKAEADLFLAEYLMQCAALRERHARERDGHKLAWTKRSEARRAAYAPLRDRRRAWEKLHEMQRQGGQALGRRRGRELRRE